MGLGPRMYPRTPRSRVVRGRAAAGDMGIDLFFAHSICSFTKITHASLLM